MFNHYYLAHVGGADAAAMRTGGEVMAGEDPQPPLFIHNTRVRIDLLEALQQPMMLQNRVYKELVCVAHHPQITPGSRQKERIREGFPSKERKREQHTQERKRS